MVFSAFPVFGDLSNQTRFSRLTNLMPTSASKVITVYMRRFSENATRLTAMGIVSLLLTSLMMMLTIRRTFNEIWRVNEPRPLFRRIVLYWAVMTLGPFLVGGSLSLTSWLVSESADYASLLPYVGAGLLDSAMAAVGDGVFAAVLCRAQLQCARRRRSRRCGGCHSVPAGQKGFAMYIKAFGSYKMVYGAFASIPIFLLWVYVVGSTIPFGAALAATLGYWRRVRGGVGRWLAGTFHCGCGSC